MEIPWKYNKKMSSYHYKDFYKDKTFSQPSYLVMDIPIPGKTVFILRLTWHRFNGVSGQHVHVVALVNGEILSRPYTPISSYDDQGLVDFIIKVGRERYWPFVRGIHSWQVDSPHKGSVTRALMLSLMVV